jgi:hypothetical protein
MRDVDAFALCHLPNGFAGACGHDFAVDGEEELVGHIRTFLCWPSTAVVN